MDSIETIIHTHGNTLLRICLCLLGNYQGLEFRENGANAFYMQNKNMEIIEFLYDRENKALIEKAS